MLNHLRSWLYVGNELRPFVVLDRVPGLYGLKYDSATAYGLPLYLCSYKLDGSITGTPSRPRSPIEKVGTFQILVKLNSMNTY